MRTSRRGLSWSAVFPQPGVVLECSFPRFPRMRAQAASETGLPGFSGGKKHFLSKVFSDLLKNTSDFTSFCVADGFKTNLSYLKVLSFSGKL